MPTSRVTDINYWAVEASPDRPLECRHLATAADDHLASGARVTPRCHAGDHAFVLVGIAYDRLIVNDPLPSDKTRYSGDRSRGAAAVRAVRFELASVRRMTRGGGGKPRGDCFMVPPTQA